MSSQTDKKDEFRKWLEKKKVIDVLTKALTDLFESEARPDDPLLYLHTKIGEHVKKQMPTSTAPAPTPAPAPTHAPTTTTTAATITPSAAPPAENKPEIAAE